MNNPLGEKSSGNSTVSPLLASEEFTGDWEVNRHEHALLRLVSDTDGTIIVEFGIPTPTGVKTVFSGAVSVFANVPYFRTLVKGAEAAMRIRLVNSASDQSEFYVFVTYGSNYFPPSVSADNEVLSTTKEATRTNFVALGGQDIGTTTYSILVDLSDTTGYRHDFVGRIDLASMYITVDRQGTSQGLVQVGVITRINGTDADITFVQGVGFSKTDERSLIRDRVFAPNRLRCGVESGALKNVASNFKALNVTAVNTATPLPTAIGGTAAPAVGDMITVATHSSGGTFDYSTSGFYLTEREA